MAEVYKLIKVVQDLAQSTDQAQELIGELEIDRRNLAAENDRLLRRAIVAELALKRVVAEVNPHLPVAKQMTEFDRVVGMVEDDRVGVQAAIEAEKLVRLGD